MEYIHLPAPERKGLYIEDERYSPSEITCVVLCPV